MGSVSWIQYTSSGSNGEAVFDFVSKLMCRASNDLRLRTIALPSLLLIAASSAHCPPKTFLREGRTHKPQ